MATLTIRKLHDGVYARLRSRAKANNRLLAAEAREILGARIVDHEDPHVVDHEAFVADLHAFHIKMRERHGVLPDSTPGFRAERDGS